MGDGFGIDRVRRRDWVFDDEPEAVGAPDSTLPDRAYARAVVEGEERGYLVMGHLCLDVGTSRDGASRTCGMKVGDTFRWGTREARVVRIAWPEPPFSGWVEAAVR